MARDSACHPSHGALALCAAVFGLAEGWEGGCFVQSPRADEMVGDTCHQPGMSSHARCNVTA